MFQSTLPCGERHQGKTYILINGKVSIHAPVRGATLLSRVCWYGTLCFNPRSRAGSDLTKIEEDLALFGFNPRSRAGSDRRYSQNTLRVQGFNPRSRAGSDI